MVAKCVRRAKRARFRCVLRVPFASFALNSSRSGVMAAGDFAGGAGTRAQRALDIALIFDRGFGPCPVDAAAGLAQRVAEASHHAWRHMANIAKAVALERPIVLGI